MSLNSEAALQILSLFRCVEFCSSSSRCLLVPVYSFFSLRKKPIRKLISSASTWVSRMFSITAFSCTSSKIFWYRVQEYSLPCSSLIHAVFQDIVLVSAAGWIAFFLRSLKEMSAPTWWGHECQPDGRNSSGWVQLNDPMSLPGCHKQAGTLKDPPPTWVMMHEQHRISTWSLLYTLQTALQKRFSFPGIFCCF